MPFKWTLKKTKRYNVSSKNQFVVSVQLLDNTLIECTLTPESLAQECLQSIAQRIELTEGMQYFGLKYLNKQHQFRWVELERPLKKQLDKTALHPLLYFGVVFYVNNSHKIQDEMTRYQFFLQIKNDVIEGRIACAPEQAVLLASYSLQAEFGDHDCDRHSQEYLKEYVLLPKHMTTDEHVLVGLTQEVTNAHRSQQGFPPVMAEMEYIKFAQQLDGFGQEYYTAKDDSGKELLLGTSIHGIYVRHKSGELITTYSWEDVKQMSYNKNFFLIHPEKGTKALKYIMEDQDTAKYTWNMCVQLHQFYKVVGPEVKISEATEEKDLFRREIQSIPDIQQSVQQHGKIQDMGNSTQKVVISEELYQHQDSTQSDPMSQMEYFSHSQHSLDQNTEPPTQANGHVMAGNNPYQIPLTQTSQSHLGVSQTSLQDPRQMLLPAYRPSPSYDQVMQQRMLGGNIGDSLVYSHPETMAYSQPEIRTESIYNMQEQYVNLVRGQGHRNGHVVINNGGGGGGGSGERGSVVDRVNSMNMYPAVSTPELNTQGTQPPPYCPPHLVTTDSSYCFKPPPPYPRPSRSTPDLASQTNARTISDSPDLVSRRNINPNAVPAHPPPSYAQYHSFDDLATQVRAGQTCEVSALEQHTLDQNFEDQQNMINIHHGAALVSQTDPQVAAPVVTTEPVAVNHKMYKSFENLADLKFDEVPIEFEDDDDGEGGGEREPPPPDLLEEERKSNASDATFHEHFSEPEEETRPHVRERKSRSKSDPSAVAVPAPAPATAIRHSYHYSDSSQDSTSAITKSIKPPVFDESIVQQRSRAASVGTGAVKSSAQQTPEEAGAKGQDSKAEFTVGSANTAYDSDKESIQCLDVTALDKDDAGGRSHSKSSSIDTTSSGHGVLQGGPGPLGDVKRRSKKKTEMDSSEDEDSELKHRSIGPLRLAAMNGLTVSRPTLKAQQNDEARAPKDERRKILENKLEEGQVFVEYEKLPKRKAKSDCSTALKEENTDRNRFKDVVPYEENRVKLKPTKENKTGYINASHIKLKIRKEDFWYIATQAPMAKTAGDFWQLVWEWDVQVISMLTELMEAGKEKCFPYWPDKPNEVQKYGEYEVKFKFANDSLCYVTSNLEVRHVKSKQTKTVWHLQYTDWPDHGCPDDIYGFLSYLDEIESVHRHALGERTDSYRTPILVHCSAGVGRTGVVILTEVMKACLEFNEPVDIPGVLTKIREQRMHMVQTVGQYGFVYKTLIQYLKNSRLI
ncbi:tyrosine-protein phosphatase non-receptor type 21-like [Lingula anatina]|uniref:protein-tyrosine-phosphatase n=1 Tax=Lingula anatina TaxID=7574 RepID=A0A1S3HWI2_LINAN|nr:tyrosine-protein phosphatase non-receptor type 21-like [Lingula anatina]XP_013390401.1 tyrosine-protein phosphatase non-receptor type 21-like [Lingula anatina]XP_013390402.1 tyrosine-protein phosphatase non-receptor type 21-like [Lingula anatina]|eukprot:XP_013390400.1 tyrosine-protein phosphatase non-receptor type 21-like [Lingula anatina]